MPIHAHRGVSGNRVSSGLTAPFKTSVLAARISQPESKILWVTGEDGAGTAEGGDESRWCDAAAPAAL